MTRTEMTEQFDLFDSFLAHPEMLLTSDIDRRTLASFSNFRSEDGKCLQESVIEYLKTIPCFSMCYLSWSTTRGVNVVFPPLAYGPYKQSYDPFAETLYPILYFSLTEKTYTIYNDVVDHYKLLVEYKPELKIHSLDPWYEQFLDTSFLARLSKIKAAIHSNKKPITRFHDVIFWIKYPHSRAKVIVSQKIETERARIEAANEKAKQQYDKEVYYYAFAYGQAPGYIQLVTEKQKQIIEYLQSVNPKFTADEWNQSGTEVRVWLLKNQHPQQSKKLMNLAI